MRLVPLKRKKSFKYSFSTPFVMVQEFFSSRESNSELMNKLVQSGFEKAKTWNSPTYVADDAFIQIRNEDNLNLSEIPNNSFFLVELKYPLSRYKADHPLHQFFSSLEKACAHGMGVSDPEYGIREYTLKR